MKLELDFPQLILFRHPVIMECCQSLSPNDQILCKQPATSKTILHTIGARESQSQQNHTLREVM